MLTGFGCTTPIKYDLTNLEMTTTSPSRQSLKVAILPFEDLRPEIEKNASSTYSTIRLNDRAIEGESVSKSISEALAAHFNHVKLFQSVDVFDETGTEPISGINKRLHDLGYSAVFTGKVRHFHSVAYATTLDKVAPIVAFLIPVSAAITIPMILAEKNNIDTLVEIVDVRLNETRTGKVLWSGSYMKKPRRQYADAYCVQAASDTLKDIAIEIVDEIEKINFNRLARK
jgi:hypothetical protein